MKDKSIVTIKPEAYYKMLLHVLRFGNKEREKNNFNEVMGILIGRLEGKEEIKNVIVEDAVPVSHGGSIEVSFATEDYAAFANIDQKYMENDPPLFGVGWYHSHPQLTIFFSGTDIKNQLGWQGLNPSAIGIVFDHVYLENPGDLGFRTFRLDDPSKGINSKYHEVKTIVEVPDSLNYYVKLIKILNSIHVNEPVILEINETPDFFGNISIPSQEQLKSKKPKLNSEKMVSQLKSGLDQFIGIVLTPIIQILNDWGQKTLIDIIKNNLIIREDLVEITNTIKRGFNELQKTIRNIILEELFEIETVFKDQVEIIQNHDDHIKDIIIEIKSEMNEKINKIFEEQLLNPYKEILEETDKITNKIITHEHSVKQKCEILESQDRLLVNLKDNFHSHETKVKDFLQNNQELVNRNLNNYLNEIKGELDYINNMNETQISYLSDLESKITKFKTEMKSKIDNLEDDSSDDIMRIFTPIIRRRIIELIHMKGGFLGFVLHKIGSIDENAALTSNRLLLDWNHDDYMKYGEKYTELIVKKYGDAEVSI